MLKAIRNGSARAGHGVLLVSSERAGANVAAGRLIKCSDIGFWMGSYHLVIGDEALRRSAVRLFWDWVLDESAALRSLRK